MNRKMFYLFAIMIMALIISFTGCKKSGDNPVEKTPPAMESLNLTGEAKDFSATVTFSVGVFRNNDAKGNLDNSSFNLSVEGPGDVSVDSYEVTHTAGEKTAKIAITLNKLATDGDKINVRPAGGSSIYNAQGVAMSADETVVAALKGGQIITIKDDGNGTGTTTWTANNTYLLDGFVFVNDGQTLTIEAGTLIKGKPGQGEEASALIVARGGKIMAEGNAENPIIFTAEADDLNGSVPDLDNGLWGGVIILGSSRLNTDPSVQQIEGIPTTEPRGEYGGNDDNDNSGVLKYVSIRHGGTDIGEGNEINGLTLGAVGSRTVIEYIEIFSNKDDGIEFFGGTARLKHIVVAFCADDSYDYDQGYRGYGQYWLAVQGYGRGDRLGEHDGGTDPETGKPFAIPDIYNATYMGRGSGTGKQVLIFRDNAGGHYANSIMVNQDRGAYIELLTGECSYTRFQKGDLTLENNIFWAIGDDPVFAISAADDVPADSVSVAAQIVAGYFATAGNVIRDPGIGIDETGSYFNPIPSNSVGGTMSSVPDAWFETTNYKGAFDPSSTNNDNWAYGWTLFSKYMRQ
ncbi:MAG TPA: hypothetical protein ENH02_01675 [Bacteroidetes bacterium]|nr:hypothetical protein [Bacteroidota bacterium]